MLSTLNHSTLAFDFVDQSKRLVTCRGCKGPLKNPKQCCGHGNDQATTGTAKDMQCMSHTICDDCFKARKHVKDIDTCQFCHEDKNDPAINWPRGVACNAPLRRAIGNAAFGALSAKVGEFVSADETIRGQERDADRLAPGGATAIRAAEAQARREARAAVEAVMTDDDRAALDSSVKAEKKKAEAAEAAAEEARLETNRQREMAAEKEEERAAEAARADAAEAEAEAAKKAAKAAAKEAAKAAKEAAKEAAKLAKLSKTQSGGVSKPGRTLGKPKRGESVNGAPTKKATDAAKALKETQDNFDWFHDEYGIQYGKGGKPGAAMLPAIITVVQSLQSKADKLKAAKPVFKKQDRRVKAMLNELRRKDPAYYTDSKLRELDFMDAEEEEAEEAEEAPAPADTADDVEMTGGNLNGVEVEPAFVEA